MNAEIKKLNPFQRMEQELRTLRTENTELKVINKGSEAIIRDVTKDLFELKDKLTEAEEALANALAENEKLISKKSDAELEMSLVKAVGMNSPEMRDAKERITELESISEAHQKLNGDLRREITALEQEKLEIHLDNKKLSQQVEDSLDRLRKSGM
jgi:chromosome condensin MukBEF MukE localization factor